MFVTEIGAVLTTISSWPVGFRGIGRDLIFRSASGSGSLFCLPISPSRSPKVAAKRKPTA